MLEGLINDVLGVFRATFVHSDWVGLLIAFGSVLLATLLMRRGTQLGSMTLLALVLFAVAGVTRNYFAAAAPEGGALDGGRLVRQIEASWGALMSLQAGTLLAYFIAFMALILVLFGAKALLSRA